MTCIQHSVSVMGRNLVWTHWIEMIVDQELMILEETATYWIVSLDRFIIGTQFTVLQAE